MNLKRAVHKAIQAGTTLHATVEAYSLGRATVRISGTGARLSNLSTIGGELEPGDKVIVDYSAGTPPFVRPAWIPEYEAPPMPTSLALEYTGLPKDWGVDAYVYYNYPYPCEDPFGPWGDARHRLDWYGQWIHGDEETVVWIADNYGEIDEGEWFWWNVAEYYDTGPGTSGMQNETALWSDHITINRGGMYILTASIRLCNLDGHYQYDEDGSFPVIRDGYIYSCVHYRGEVRLAILKNGTQICKTNRRIYDGTTTYQYFTSEVTMRLTTLEQCSAGDSIQVQLYEDNQILWYNDGWLFPGQTASDMLILKAQMVPNSDTS